MTLTQVAIVAAGGAIGSTGRLLVGRACLALVGTNFPLATLVVNVLGCTIAGYLLGHSTRVDAGSTMRLFLVIGLLGGFTTFSAFGVETIALAQRGQWNIAALSVAANLVLGFGGAALGTYVGRL
jgi:CrcB protein